MRFHPLPLRPAQRGIVLPLSLVILVMVTMMAIAAIRGVTTEERIAANLRASSVAFEQAELGLRHCEAIAWANDPSLSTRVFDSTQTTGEAWRVAASWNDARVQSPPTSQYQFQQLAVTPPRCMIEQVLLRPPVGGSPSFGAGTEPRANVITARGFGDNAALSGFRATVQSQLRPR